VAKKIAAADKANSDKKGKPVAEELLTSASSELSSTSDRLGQNTIKLDHFGDRTVGNPDNQRPLSPNLITVKQESSATFGGFKTDSHGKSLENLNTTSCAPTSISRTSNSSTNYDSAANSSVLAFVQTDDREEEKEPELFLSPFSNVDIDQASRHGNVVELKTNISPPNSTTSYHR